MRNNSVPSQPLTKEYTVKGRVWVNFKELRARLKFEDVLTHFRVEVRRKGEQHQGFCPLPGHKGKGNSPSFSANLERGIFHCFGCGAKGNVLEFAALMRGSDPKDGDALRIAAVELQTRFFPEGASRAHPVAESPAKPALSLPPASPALINPPLDFELKGLDAGHEYLLGRGFARSTLAHFGVGFCSRGLLKDRVAIPLHDSVGNLVGYAGRMVDDALITDENPRYRFPSGRDRGGARIEFRKSLFLYNGHRIAAPVDDLVVVEGFPSVWWLHEHGCPPTVALMGSECSDEQADLIVAAVKPSGRLWLMPDGDKAGERLAQEFLALLSPHRFVRWVKLGDGRQPTDLPALTLKTNFTL
jgi:DNA primase